VRDSFKVPIEKGAVFCGRPILDWIATPAPSPKTSGLTPTTRPERSLWNARVFPAERSPSGYRDWLWMYAPKAAAAAQKQAYLASRRYSATEIAWLADQTAFHARRLAFCKHRAASSGVPASGVQ
jgi:hypothetical protein